MIIRYFVASIFYFGLSVSAVTALAENQATSADPQKSSEAHKFQAKHEDDGARIFRQNCARCHNSPEGFSPRISGTVVQHMRVRASLSKEDQEKLLRFFNP